jgi:hypothetical protein
MQGDATLHLLANMPVLELHASPKTENDQKYKYFALYKVSDF